MPIASEPFREPSISRPSPSSPPAAPDAGSVLTRGTGLDAVVGMALRAWTVLALAVLLGTGLAVATAPAALAAPEELILEDTAGVIYEPQLRAEIEQIDFHEPTTVVVFTQRGEYDSNFNERVLAYAREHHPEWISADGQKWADGLFVYGIDPEGRHIGTYFGEDRKVETSQQNEIQQATAGLARDAQWTDAAVRGVQEAAKLMNRPWYQNPVLLFYGGLGVAGVGAVTTVVVARRRKRQREAEEFLKEGRESFSNVALDLEATELNARTIPSSSRYGAQVLEKYRSFEDDFRAVAQENDRLSAVDPKKTHTQEFHRAAGNFAAEAARLDALDDVVVHTNTFLNRQSGWQDSWDVQSAPLRQDLDRLVTEKPLSQGPAWQAVSSFRTQAEAEIERLGAALAEERLSPDDALDRLTELRARFTELLDQVAQESIEEMAKDSSERELMREEYERQRLGGGRVGRARQRRVQGSILDTVYAPGHFWTYWALSQGYRRGRSEVESTRQAAAASRSSSRTGYGRSGGSFSGSGSSSRF